MIKLLKVGVIGVGGIAGRHYPGWIQSPHTEIAALADVSPEVLERVGDDLGVTRRYSSPQELIENPDIDIIDICTPNTFHASLAIAALEAGKHVLCEKPLAATPGEIGQMITARDRSGKLLMAAQHLRFQGNVKALKAELDSGVLGEIYHGRAWWLRRAGAGVTPGFAIRKNSRGGALIDIGVHILDLALWLMGNPQPVSVSGIIHERLAHQKGAFTSGGALIPEGFDVEEFGGGLVRFRNGASLILEASWMLHHSTTRGNEDVDLWLYGETGGAQWPRNEIVTTNLTTKQLLNTTLQLCEGGSPYAEECIAFAAAIVADEPSPIPPEQSLDVALILEGIYSSAASGREVHLESR